MESRMATRRYGDARAGERVSSSATPSRRGLQNVLASQTEADHCGVVESVIVAGLFGRVLFGRPRENVQAQGEKRPRGMCLGS